MKIIRHILSHSVLIIVLVALLAGFYYRTLLLPEVWNAKLNERIEHVLPQLLKFSFESSSDETTTSPIAASKPVKQGESVAVIPEDDRVLQSEIVESTVTQAPASELASEPTPPSLQEPSPIQQDVAQTPLVQAEYPDVTQADHTAQGVETASSDRVQSEAYQLLKKARTAYGVGDLSSAERHYLALTRQEPESADAFGELGNVYYTQGKWREAGGAFFEAAIRLLEQKQTAQLNYLLMVIQGLDPEKASQLNGKMAQAGLL